ncbi:MAG TPA: POTRA domain-containing protein, partial [Motiliproteus sp.]
MSDIRIDGLKRIDLGAVLRALAIDVGEMVDPYRLGRASQSLFATGYFNDIQLFRDGELLIVKVTERPAISKIELEGNKAIETDALMDGLKKLGLAEGEVFQRAALEKIRLELLRLYAAQGRYGARIETEMEELPENRLGLKISIKEGKAAAIQHINVVGNRVFDDATLRDLFELEVSGFWSFFGDSDRYSREKLSGDLERLRSYYLDRGYI